MNRRTNLKWLVVCFLGFLGMAALAKPAAWAASEPFKGVAEGAVVGVTPDPDGVVLTVQTRGNATRIGLFTRQEEILLNPVTGAISGTLVFTAANGDQIYGMFIGGFISPTTATGTYALAGCTGRVVQTTT